jgi:ubiquinone/menaquinone biosynthesis C-methylase UbiE
LLSSFRKDDWPYFADSYDTKERFCSYWHQIDEIRKRSPRQVLEIGIGNGFVAGYLRKKGIAVTTIDPINELGPNVVGSVLGLPFAGNTFDVVSCCQVLEHLPYRDFTRALMESARVSKSHVIMSVPDRTTVYRIDLELPRIPPIRRLVHHPRPRPDTHQFDGEHYWEIGKNGYPLKRIESDIRQTTLRIIQTYRVFEFPYHRFFILNS